MSSILQRLLHSLDPIRVLETVECRADDAINRFSMRSARVESWGQFQSLMTDFWLHSYCTLLGANAHAGYDRGYTCDRAMKTLCDIYGYPSGFKAAFELARTGAEGGLYEVLKRVSRQLADEQTRSIISAAVSGFWSRLSVDELHAATDEYLRDYGRYLPSEMVENGAARLRANFTRVLERHPALIRRIRRSTRPR